ncbi:unnamed protein product [Closterium sp. NIES-53]
MGLISSFELCGGIRFTPSCSPLALLCLTGLVTSCSPSLCLWGGGEFSSDLLRDFCRGEGILQSFTVPASPQQNGIAEHRIGIFMEVARTFMIHAAAPQFLWPFAVRYVAHQLNLWPCVSLLETSPTLHWTRKVGDASVFRRHVLPSHDVTFDESVPFYRLFPYHTARPPPPPLFLAPGPPPVDPLPPQGPAPSSVSQVDPLHGIAPVEVAVGSDAALGAASGGAESEGAEPGGAESEGGGSGGAEPRGAEPKGVEPGGAETEGAESRGAAPRGAASSGGPAGASPRLSSQQLCEWLVQRAHRRSGALGARGAGDTGAGGAAVTTGAGGTRGTAATGPGGARTNGAGATGTGGVGCIGAGDPTDTGAAGAGGTGAGGARAAYPGAGGARGTVRSRSYFIPLLQQVLGVPSSTSLPPPFLCPPPGLSQLPLQSASPLPAPSPFCEQSGGLTKRREPASRPVSLVRTARRAPRSRPPPVFWHARYGTPPTVSRLLATAVTDPSFDLCLPVLRPSMALGTDILEDRQEDFESLAAAAAMDAKMASLKSIGTYVDEVPHSRANIVDGMGIFRVKQPPGSPPAFKARYVARSFRQRQGVDYF